MGICFQFILEIYSSLRFSLDFPNIASLSTNDDPDGILRYLHLQGCLLATNYKLNSSCTTMLMHLVAMGLSISLSSKPSLSLKRRYSASSVPAPTTITAAPAATVLEPTVRLGFEMTLGIRHYILCLKYSFTSV